MIIGQHEFHEVATGPRAYPVAGSASAPYPDHGKESNLGKVIGTLGRPVLSIELRGKQWIVKTMAERP